MKDPVILNAARGDAPAPNDGARGGDFAAKLEVMAQSNEMIWNAVAVDGKRICVAGPRWTGAAGPAVAMIGEDGNPRPYPNFDWNNWAPGDEAQGHFVNVNAIHLDRNRILWVVDTGSPRFGGDPLAGGAKLVKIDLASDKVVGVFPLGSEIAKPGSYVDDVRFKGRFGYLTDAGRPGLIVFDSLTGISRRVLDDHVSTTAPKDRRVVVGGKEIEAPDGSPLRIHSDPLELSPDGKWLYFAPLTGPWYRVETELLDDPQIDARDLESKVEEWLDLPPVGGTTMASNGDLYFTDLAQDALKRRTAAGVIETIVSDPRLHWVDAPFIDPSDFIWLPVPQMDRVPLFNGEVSKITWPIELLRLKLPE